MEKANFVDVEKKLFVDSLVRELDTLRCQNRELQYVLMKHDLSLPEGHGETSKVTMDTSVLQQEICQLKQRVRTLEDQVDQLRHRRRHEEDSDVKELEMPKTSRRNSRIVLRPIDRTVSEAWKTDNEDYEAKAEHKGRRSKSRTRLPSLPSKFRGCNHPRRLHFRGNRQLGEGQPKEDQRFSTTTTKATSKNTTSTKNDEKRLPNISRDATLTLRRDESKKSSKLEVEVEHILNTTATTTTELLPSRSSLVPQKPLKTSLRR